MTDFRNFEAPTVMIGNEDYARLGKILGVGEDEIRAVVEVETSGGGMDSAGRLKMLFEPHIAYRLTRRATQSVLVANGLAYPKQGTLPYPKDSYPRLTKAIGIMGDEMALRCASWGIGQIMGGNFVAAGYDSAVDMVLDFQKDEDNQLEAMIRFILANHLDDELRAHNWAAFARGYNGPNYAKGGYHTKLAAAYAKWAKIPDTVLAEDGDSPMPYLVIGSRGAAVKLAQTLLIASGFKLGKAGADGIFGDDTHKAVRAFQRARKLATINGKIGTMTWRALMQEKQDG